MKRLAVVTVLLLAAVLALSAVASASGTLSGSYRTRIGAKPLGGQLEGTWTIKFSHGNYKVSLGSRTAVKGKYTISGSTVRLGQETGPLACSSTGTYRYRISGSTLKFTRVSDGSSACAGRAAVLAGSFTKV
jgi:hypothetical protein